MSFHCQKMVTVAFQSDIRRQLKLEPHPDWSHVKFPMIKHPAPFILEFHLGCIPKETLGFMYTLLAAYIVLIFPAFK